MGGKVFVLHHIGIFYFMSLPALKMNNIPGVILLPAGFHALLIAFDKVLLFKVLYVVSLIPAIYTFEIKPFCNIREFL